MIFFTADTHFNHRNIIEYCTRGFRTAKEMNNFIIKRWNEKVSPRDTVYHLGDFGLDSQNGKQLAAIREKLNGRIILILGNHDCEISQRKWKDLIKIDEIVTELELPDFYIRHHPPVKYHLSPTICGHVHNLWKINKELNAVNIGVDVRNYYPLSYAEIIEEIAKLTFLPCIWLHFLPNEDESH